ncbi:MAG: beta-lactamase family protein [Planctomycetota bacterium]|nr:beta-lactamase family protein [Planctomycetota bacterium]
MVGASGRLVVLVLVLSAVTARAGDVVPLDLGPRLAPLVAKYHLPGMVGAIVHGDRVVALGSTGVRKVGDPTPFLATDVIHLGSDTKAMTAILIGRLIDEKQLTFETPMAEIFPNLARKMDPETAKITVRNLLDHDAGFPHDLLWRVIEATHFPITLQRRMAVQQALSAPPVTPIGSYSYSNVSFVVLGAIVEAKTGKTWEEAMQQEIFGPLKMESAGFGFPGTRGTVDQPWGHVLESGQLKPIQIDNAPVMGPAGTVHCSIVDWSKFITEMLKSAEGNPTLLSAKTFNALTTPMPGQSYAGGWIIAPRPWAGGTTLTHGGNNTTFDCNVWIAPKKDFALMIATNYGSEPVDTAADEGIGMLIGVNSGL